MKKFKNKYRIQFARLSGWDFGSAVAYYITICTANRTHYFGALVDGFMQLNEIGVLAKKYWIEITDHFSFVELGNFVIMPNRMHGILIIPENRTDMIHRVCTSSKINGGITSTHNPMFYINISRFYDQIIGNNKSFNRIQKYIADNPSKWGRYIRCIAPYIPQLKYLYHKQLNKRQYYLIL